MSGLLQAFINPKALRDKSEIGGLLSLLIILLELCLLFVPAKSVMHKQEEAYASKSTYTEVFYNAKDDYNQTIDGIKDSAYYIEDNTLKTKKQTEEIKTYKYTFEYDGTEKTIYVCFDVNDYLYNKENEYINEYKALYPSDDSANQILAGVLSHYFVETTQEDAYQKYHAMTLEELNSAYDELTYFKRLGITESDDTYLIAFFDNYFTINLPSCLESIATSGLIVSYNYENTSLDVNNVNNIKDFLLPFLIHVSSKQIDTELTSYFIMLLFDVVGFTFVFAIVMMLVLRKRCVLKRFKEYYACMAILSIPVTVICFILTWFVSTFAGSLYMILLTLYSVIMMYRLVSIKE